MSAVAGASIGQFGCSDYECWVMTRGGRDTVGPLTGWNTLTYALGSLNGVSQATVNVPNVEQVDPACCGLIGSLRNWQYELSIRRGTEGEVWVGPIVQRRISGGALSLTAYDLAKWTERRFLHQAYKLKQVEALDLYSRLWHDAIDVENSMRAELVLGGATGVKLDFTYTGSNLAVQTAANSLRQTGVVAVDTYTRLRQTFAGRPIATFASQSPLIDDWVTGSYDTDADGSAQANTIVMQGTNRGGKQIAALARADATLIQRDGLLEAVESDQTVQTQAACQRIAEDLATIYGDSPSTVSSVTLNNRAPYRLDELAPGYLLNVALSRLCQPVYGVYRIQQLTVNVDQNGEAPNLALQWEGPVAVPIEPTGPV